jgi:chemotaxis protein methyltransferase CheR
MGKNHGPLPILHVLATDLNHGYRRKAMEAVYSSHAVRDVPQGILETFFRRFEDRYAVSDHLKADISWEISDLTSPPRYTGRFQVIFLRNSLLTYYKKQIIETAFPLIVDNLATGGFLITGIRENPPCECASLSRWYEYPCIFRKI